MRSALTLLLVGLAGCHPTTSKLWGPRCLTPEAEALAGTRAAPQIEARYGGVVRDMDAERHMERLGQRICLCNPNLQAEYRYRLLSTDKVNAFSLPGGRVYVTRGLYARLGGDELLAAVLAHEMAHLASKDHFKSRCRGAGEALQNESAADAQAVTYLRAAGINPEAMIGVIRLIRDVQPRGWSHSRVTSIAGLAAQASSPDRYLPNQP